jgi:hypothetical protein
MDTSESYFKMCQKATEIQSHIKVGLYKGMAGDWFAKPDKEVKYLIYILSANCVQLNGTDIWLPRQDQLQAMLLNYLNFTSTTWGLLSAVYHKTWKETEYYSLFISMEQLWLSFVMYEKYNKIWNGKDWVMR